MNGKGLFSNMHTNVSHACDTLVCMLETDTYVSVSIAHVTC
jgi:hypothetical protein